MGFGGPEKCLEQVLQLPGAPIFLGVVLIGVVLASYHRFSGPPKKKKKVIVGERLAFEPLQLEHQHPKGWGSKAIMEEMKELPAPAICDQLIQQMQEKGFVVVDNLYEALPVEKLTYDVNDILRKYEEKPESHRVGGSETVKDCGQFILTAIDFLTNRLIDGLNEALLRDAASRTEETAYTHTDVALCEFSGFSEKQLRLRYPGHNLDTHVDRSSALVTVLYYLNTPVDGEIVLYLLNEEKRKEKKYQEGFKKDGGLSLLEEGELLPAVIAPKANNLVLFWSDCVPHEVLQTSSPRLAFQVWYSKKK
mmetsp:Transcript_23896/g.37222  ORF Transcript_23896/g.37222 Transcript_23896/m.37222 type:complete len:307 (-) Transcript_23896:26-946(-)|eukprot:CAMPEP_0201506900 /NCGR_PEP_ID=MMETSP0161_2-20130828/730_1 /ASSEMBLY_ACC=CAM_ASM_000251 /TAXON_ID=180227 /ORGANISM="Neoparamoeba aestuarina, Strain SoJaBio B1-5/56/2" /LENGTH=306 /DNA_ID=CAMNT_0047901139 /DNA_START=60 /DNA_END=980 /DNA_ORIENTATION=+